VLPNITPALATEELADAQAISVMKSQRENTVGQSVVAMIELRYSQFYDRIESEQQLAVRAGCDQLAH
jgi:hypothetical protein